MLNTDRLTFQEHQLTWDNKLTNELKNFSDSMNENIHWQGNKIESDEQRTFILWSIENQKNKLKEILNDWEMAAAGIDPLTINEGHRYEDMTKSIKKEDDILFKTIIIQTNIFL